MRKTIAPAIITLSFIFCVSWFCPLPSWSQAVEESADDSQETVLPHVYTYIETSVAEQRVVFTQQDIEKMHVESVTSLIASAGIQTLSYGAYGTQSAPSIRGFTGSSVRVVIDGVCVNSEQNGTFDFTSLNIDDIEKIEIVRGGFTESVSGEGAVGGVIYITTKNQSLTPVFSADVFTKSYFSAAVPFDTEGASFSFSGRTGENTFLKTNVKGTFAKNAFPYVAYDDSIKYRKNSSVIDGSADVQLTHYFGYGNSWYVGDSLYSGYKNIAGMETSTTPGVQQDCNNRLSTGISLPSLAQKIKLESSLVWQSANEWYDESDESSSHYLNTVSLNATGTYFASERVTEQIGTVLNAVHLDSTNDGDHFLFSGFVKETTKLFFGDRYSCSIPLAFSFSGSNIAFVPKLGFCVELQNVAFKLDGYRMSLFPDMNQLYWGDSSYACGNEDLAPEDGWGGELSCTVKEIAVPFSVCVFSNYYFNKIQWQNINGKWQPVNVASAFYAGCDLSASTVVFSCITIKASGEYVYNKLLAEGITYGKRIMYTPDVTASLSVSYESDLVTVTVDVSYVGKRYISNLNQSFLEPYVLLNAAISCRAGKHITPYVRFDNILNGDYESVPSYPMPGISLTAGVKAKW